MLDQNTDRMWYVIGAVIVGAALIFLMNGTIPTLFGTIGETFEHKVEQSTEMTDGIRPQQRKTIYTNPRYTYSGHATGNGFSIGSDERSVIVRDIDVLPNTVYEISYTPRTTARQIVLFTQNGPLTASNRVHNAIYHDAAKVEQLTLGKIIPDVDVRLTHTFKTGANVTHLSMTSGNETVLDAAYGSFRVEYEDIQLVELYRE